MIRQQRFVSHSYQKINLIIGEELMQFFYQAGGKNHISDESGLNDQYFLHRAKMGRNFFTERSPPLAGLAAKENTKPQRMSIKGG